MRFIPKSEEELQSISLLEPGIYQFQVALASNETSKSGNEMIKLTLNLWDKNGCIHNIYDYLLEAVSYKLRHFCEAAGIIDKYDHGEIYPTDCIGLEGYVDIIIKEGSLKENGERYPNRNAVKDYVKKSATKDAVKEDFVDDDVPFL